MDKPVQYIEDIKQEIGNCDCLLIGIGSEWSKTKDPEVKKAYQSLYQVINGKNYFIITTATDGLILETGLDSLRIVAPCGNGNWLQCSESSSKDIWELGEGFKTPTVIRWPFEKTVYFNQKSHMYRVNETLCQITEEIKDQAVSVNENSVVLIKKLVTL